ncbi:MAG: hypothetical protein LBJ00_04275 [Planctomycetaceae bacterium]|jgi:hypothetical protein|nr:hypothetical protein [Planctomycetaceae bacterium]
MAANLNAGSVVIDIIGNNSSVIQQLHNVNTEITNITSRPVNIPGLQGTWANIRDISVLVGNIKPLISQYITTPLRNAITEFASFGDQFSKLAQRTGMSAHSLSLIGYAAEQSGASVGELANGMRAFARVSGAASRGEKAGKDAFQIANLDFDKIKTLPIEEQFLEVADAIASINDPIRQADASMKVFGRGGIALLPLIQERAKGIRDLMNEGETLGIGISNKDAENATILGDAIDRMMGAFRGVRVSIIAAIAKNLSDFADTVAYFTAEISKWIKQNQAAFRSLLALSLAALVASPVILYFRRELLALAATGIRTAIAGIARLTTSLLAMFATGIRTAIAGLAQLTASLLALAGTGIRTAIAGLAQLTASLLALAATGIRTAVADLARLTASLLAMSATGIRTAVAGLAQLTASLLALAGTGIRTAIAGLAQLTASLLVLAGTGILSAITEVARLTTLLIIFAARGVAVAVAGVMRLSWSLLSFVATGVRAAITGLARLTTSLIAAGRAFLMLGFRAVATGFSMLLSPIGLIVIAIGAAVGAFLYFRTTLFSLANIKSTFAPIIKFFSTLYTLISNGKIQEAVKYVILSIKLMFENIKNICISYFNQIYLAVQPILTPIIGFFVNMGKQIYSIFETAFSWLAGLFGNQGTSMSEFWSSITSNIGETIVGGWWTIATGITNAIATVEQVWNDAITSIMTTWLKASSVIARGVGFILAKIQGLGANELMDTIKQDYEVQVKEVITRSTDRTAEIEAQKRDALAYFDNEASNALTRVETAKAAPVDTSRRDELRKQLDEIRASANIPKLDKDQQGKADEIYDTAQNAMLNGKKFNSVPNSNGKTGTFSAFEMNSIGGNVITDILKSQQILQKLGNTYLQRIADASEEGLTFA